MTKAERDKFRAEIKVLKASGGRSLDLRCSCDVQLRLLDALDQAEAESDDLRSKLAQARAAAVQWVIYDGTVGTLPGIGMIVLLVDPGYDGVTPAWYRATPEGRYWGHFEPWFDERFREIQLRDCWAHLPKLPEAAQ